MNPSAPDKVFFDLMSDLAEDRISSDDAVRLADLLRDDPAMQRKYVDFLLLVGGLHRIRGECGEAPDITVANGDPLGLPGSHFPDISLSPSLVTTHNPLTANFVGGPVFSYMVATLVLCMMLLGAWAYKITHDSNVVENERTSTPAVEQTPRAIARITGMKDCVPADGNILPLVGAYIPPGKRFSLNAGLLEITHTDGARVILEGPCEYTADSSTGGFLRVGKLVAKVEKNDELRMMNNESHGRNSDIHHSSFMNHPLFSVRTPTAIVTDLGTEFGVEVNDNGSTTSFVFQGTVRVDAITDKVIESVLLQKNESARVIALESGTRMIRNAGGTAIPKFVRRLGGFSKMIDLLDIVAGGDGTGINRERGIDPTTGMQDTMFFSGARDGDRNYRTVDWHPLIDGVFVPDGSAGAVKVDSTGNTYDGFPRTCGQAAFSIWARAAEIRHENLQSDRSYWVYNMGRGDRYMPEKRGLLAMNSNSGITFDLEAIRRTNPDIVPNIFRAYVSLADRIDPTTGLNTRWIADYWIFVDGRLSVKRERFCVKDGTVPLCIELKSTDRFLTLVVTDGGNMDRIGDCLLFGDPVLEASEPLQKIE